MYQLEVEVNTDKNVVTIYTLEEEFISADAAAYKIEELFRFGFVESSPANIVSVTIRRQDV